MNTVTIRRFPLLGYACSEAVNTLCTNLSFAGENVRKIDLGLRADEHQPVSLAKPGKMRVFRKEAVAGMNRLRAGKLGSGDDAVLVQIALLGWCRADTIAFVRHRHVQRALVRLGVYRDGRDAHLLAGADDAHGDLPAVGNEYL